MEQGSLHIKTESEEMDSSDFEGHENDVLDDIQEEMLIEDDLKTTEEVIKTEEQLEDKAGILENAQTIHDSWLKEWAEPEEDVKNFVITKTTRSAKQERFIESEKLNTNDDPCTQEKTGIKCQERSRKGKVVNKRASKSIRPKNSNGPAIAQVIKDADVSETASFGRCTFKCPCCHLQMKSWRQFTRHLMDMHKKKALWKDINNYMIKATVHECKICSEKILCESSIMHIHFRKHNTNIGKYRQKYTQKQRPLDEATVSDSITSNLCTFKCTDCLEIFPAWERFGIHYRRKHEKTASTRDVLSFLQKATVHECRICSERVYCDCTFLSLHLRFKHNTTIKAYRQQYNCRGSCSAKSLKLLEGKKSVTSEIIGNFCSYKCPKCGKTYKSLTSMRMHGRTSKKCPSINFEYLKDYLKKMVTYNCKICSKVLLCDETVVLGHCLKVHKIKTLKEYANATGAKLQENCLVRQNKAFARVTKDAEFLREAGNFCRFACKSCSYSSECWATLQAHLRKSNHWSSSSRDWSTYITKVVLHQCIVCKKKLLNDKGFLSRHIMGLHKHSLPDYREKFSI